MTAQIEIFNKYNNSPVYLYVKNGHDLVGKVHEFLSKRLRWDDADYLARILFCVIIPEENWYDEKGFGIGTSMYDGLDLLISINVPKQTIKIQRSSNLHNYTQMSFEDFVEKFYNSASL